jgi:serine/threonine-protein phosphatase 2A regulatory subunit B''
MSFTASSGIKVKEFFVNWLTDDSVQPIFEAVQSVADALLADGFPDFDFSVFTVTEAPAKIQVPVAPPGLSTSSTSFRSLAGIHSSRSEFPVLSASGTDIPTFFGPVRSEEEREAVRNSADLAQFKVAKLFEEYCQLPGCFAPVFLELHIFQPLGFEAFWKQNLLGHDSNHRLLRILVGPDRQKIVPVDLFPYVQALAGSHGSLSFLKEQPQFLPKYVEFVVIRIFFAIDWQLKGTIDIHQLRKYDLAGLLYGAAQMADINDIHCLFGYQHFSVSYCKFWELDLDCDGLLSRYDLSKFDHGTFPPRILDRYFKSKLYPRSAGKPATVDFVSFCYLLMCTEDKTTRTAINFWYHLCDLDDDGVLSLQEIEELYINQQQRMVMTGNESISWKDILRQFMDSIIPKNAAAITVHDLCACGQADLFFEVLVDLQRFLRREAEWPLMKPEFDESVGPVSPWECYVIIAYSQLVKAGD